MIPHLDADVNNHGDFVDGIKKNGNGQAALSPNGQAALAYLEAGLSPVPLCWPNESGECGCFKHHTIPRDIGKAPLQGEGYQDVRLTRAQVIGWWLRNPLANVGILLEPGGFLVIDSDSPEADREVEQRGVPPGPRVKSPHGIHRYFHANGSAGRTTKQGESHKIDVLSLGYVVVPPSHTPAGSYRWEIGLGDLELDDPPAWAVELLKQAKTKSQTITIDGDLSPVDLATLGLDAWLIEVITTGNTSHPDKYPSRSEALFAAITGLLNAGIPLETMVSILLDARYKISEKPRDQGQKWLLSDIARAQAKLKEEYEGNGSAPPETEWEEEDSDKAEFTTDAREEPEEPLPALYPCPDSLWIGIFAQVADLIGKRSWEVWAGVYAALSAVAWRNLDWFYYSDHLFGMSYSLLLSETGAGKGIVVNTARSLLPENYSVAYGIQSGPALIPILTDDDLNNKTGRLTVQGRPTMLICEEWSRLLQVAGIQNATLIEDLNALHHRAYPWGQGRSHKTKSGGNIEIKDPTLTICGTSTIKLFTAGLSERFIFSGGLNRYLILPGESQYEEYTGQMYSTSDLSGLLDGLITHTSGHGVSLREAYSAAAWERWLDLQRHFFRPLANDPEHSEVMKRLHVHFHHVCLLCAWSEKSPRIEMHHLRAAVQVISTSHQFLLALLNAQHSHVEPGPIQRYEMGMEQKIAAKVKREPGIAKRKVLRDLARQGSYKAIGQAVDSMLRDGLLLGTWERNQVFLRPPKGDV